MNLETILGEALSGNTVTQMSRTIGEDEQKTSTAVQTALPLLLGALARNSADDAGASSLAGALDRDHDGSILDDLAGFVLNPGAGRGEGILGHIFGGQRPQIEQSLSRASGMDQGTTRQLLVMLAPIVMGAIGRARKQQDVNAGDLSGLLGSATQRIGAGSSPTLLGTLSQMMDADGDGSAADDVMRMVGGFLSGRR